MVLLNAEYGQRENLPVVTPQELLRFQNEIAIYPFIPPDYPLWILEGTPINQVGPQLVEWIGNIKPGAVNEVWAGNSRIAHDGDHVWGLMYARWARNVLHIDSENIYLNAIQESYRDGKNPDRLQQGVAVVLGLKQAAEAIWEKNRWNDGKLKNVPTAEILEAMLAELYYEDILTIDQIYQIFIRAVYHTPPSHLLPIYNQLDDYLVIWFGSKLIKGETEWRLVDAKDQPIIGADGQLIIVHGRNKQECSNKMLQKIRPAGVEKVAQVKAHFQRPLYMYLKPAEERRDV